MHTVFALLGWLSPFPINPADMHFALGPLKTPSLGMPGEQDCFGPGSTDQRNLEKSIHIGPLTWRREEKVRHAFPLFPTQKRREGRHESGNQGWAMLGV